MSVGCHSGRSITVNYSTMEPHVLVYKTKKDYSNFVPIMLSDDKQTIISYPAPSDLKAGNNLMLPVKLKKGYLLDMKGIGKNVAFLKITYQEYVQLKEPLSIGEMMSNIIDTEPLVELYDCGVKSSFTDIEKQVNTLISKNQLQKICKSIR